MKACQFAALPALVMAFALAIGFSCGGTPAPKTSATAPGGSKDPSKWPADDHSLCGDWKNKPDLEIDESVGPGSVRPNVRRVYKMVGEHDSRHKVLICREIDTNLDGLKDVGRTFNDKGEAVHEEADTNYDGRLDVWTDFVNGQLSKEELDTNYDGKVDVWKYYIDGRLSRIRRSTHCPGGKPDTWEIYVNGHLERVGNDVSCDGHVDRWDRDSERIAAEERAQEQTADAGATRTATTADAAAATAAKP